MQLEMGMGMVCLVGRGDGITPEICNNCFYRIRTHSYGANGISRNRSGNPTFFYFPKKKRGKLMGDSTVFLKGGGKGSGF